MDYNWEDESIMDSGSIGFVMICAAFVFFMTPGLSYFYGGLVRRKNAVNTMFASVITIGTGIVMWVLFGYSLSFGTDHFGIIGDLSCWDWKVFRKQRHMWKGNRFRIWYSACSR